MNQRSLITGVLALVVVAGAWVFLGTGKESGQGVSGKSPVDTTLDFYDSWLAASQSTSTDPYQAGLADDPVLSKELRAKIAKAGENTEAEVDPVLCQAKVPTQIAALPVFEREDEAQVVVVSRDKGAVAQAIVTLNQSRGGWFINDITCSEGEIAPERGEFSFEQEGFLLKSVVPPLDPEYWHLVFEQGGEKGHAAPLLFGPASMCTSTDGSTSVCSPDQFTETSKAFVQGEMTEAGVNVKKLELRK